MAQPQRDQEIGYRRLTLLALTGAIGAEIHGVDLKRPLDAETRAEILEAFAEHLVIYFPDQRLTPEQHLAFSLIFGPHQPIPHIHSVDGYPELQIVRREADETTNVVGENWHTDSTFMETPPAGVVMRAVDVPEVGGDTGFQNMVLAYETLSAKLKEVLGGLNAVHSASRVFGSDSKRMQRRYSTREMGLSLGDREVVHPVVCTHPVTGRKFLFVNSVYVRRFEGWTEDESRGLLQTLYEHQARPALGCRVRWRNDQLLVWDNRCTQHRAIPDYQGKFRYLQRTTFGGWHPS